MDYRIKDLPKSERPREKLSEKGVSALSNVELLSLILRAGVPGKNVKELSAEILERHSLESLADACLESLSDLKGVSEVKAGQLIALGELGRRLQKEERDVIKSLSDVKNQVKDMRYMQEEKIRVFHLSAGNEVLSEQEFEGGVSSAALKPRKIFREALNCGASALILAHNHPSGKSRPTESDVDATLEIKALASELGLEVLDHVIAGEEVTSMRRSGDLEPTSQ
ncbi:MAG: RadC family protein [Candidatus Nanohaloarchaea archaeon]